MTNNNPISSAIEQTQEFIEYLDVMQQGYIVVGGRTLNTDTLRVLVSAICDPPKHKFWGAGEPDCPREIKAGNGELHTLRCKVCGQDDPRNDACYTAMTNARPDDETVDSRANDVTVMLAESLIMELGVDEDDPCLELWSNLSDRLIADAIRASMPVSGDVVEKARTVRDAALQALRACEADEGHFAAVAAATHAALKNLEGEEK